jgi:hypothetical protein
MKNSQEGSSLVVALILLTIITLVAVYSIEGSTIQSKMVASSLFSSLTYQECRNEQEANIRFYNNEGGAQRATLLDLLSADPVPDGNGGTKAATIAAGGDSGVSPITKTYVDYAAKSDISFEWSYIKEEPAARGGYNIDTEAQSRAYLFENTCDAVFRFASNNQTLGAIVEGLVQIGNVN